MRRQRGFFQLVVTVVLLVLVSGACTTEVTLPSDGVVSPPPQAPAPTTGSVDAEPTPRAETPANTPDLAASSTVEFLQQARAQTTAASSYRFEGFLEARPIGLYFGSRTEPMLFGEVSGSRSRTWTDRDNFVSENMRSFTTGPDDLIITVVAEGEVAYVRSPFFKMIIDGAGFGTEGDPWADEIAVGWGRVDLTSLDYSKIFGSIDFGAGPTGTALLDLIDVADEVSDAGSGEVRGVPTRVFNFDVSLFDIVVQSGEDLETTNLTDAKLDLLADFPTTVEVHIDADGFVRRIEYSSGFSRLAPDGLGDTLIDWQRVDYFDFGADIEVEIPAAWAEITEGLKDFSSN